jgi:transposase
MLHSGIDLHKHDLVISTVDADGAVVKSGRVPASRAAVTSYFRALGRDQRAVVESTASWYWLADLFRAEGIALALGHSKYIKAISYAKVKTDAVDAATLARLLRSDLIPEAHMVSPELREPRDLLRQRLVLVAKRTRCKNAVSGLLMQYNVDAPPALPPLPRLQAELHLEQAALLAAQIKRIEQTLHPALVPNEDVQRLLWIPGIGKLGAFTLYLEVDGIARFRAVRPFWSYCRLVPGAKNSGGKSHHKRTKDGNRYLKLAFSHAAVRAIQYYPEIRRWYLALARRKGPMVARALVATELARIVYAVLRKGEPFDGTFKGVPLSRTKSSQWPRVAARPASPDA